MRPQALSLRTDEFAYLEMLVLAVIVGVLGALGNLGFTALIEFFSWLLRHLEWNAIGIQLGGIHRLLIPAILLTGGALILLLARIFPGDVLGYGFPDFLEQVNLGNARVRRRWIFVKATGAALSLGAGASVGREGPIAQIGGAIGSAIAQLRDYPPARTKVLVAAGAGAGIATTFNAPIGGLMFAYELVLLGEAEMANLILLIVASFAAVVTSRAIEGNHTVFVVSNFVLKSYWEMATYALMGAVLGLLSASYIRVFHATASFFRRLPVPDWAKLAIGLTLVGAIAILLPDNLSDGYPIINRALAGRFELAMLAALCLAKLCASSLSLGSGAPGGVFGPVFFIGTMGGGAVQRLFEFLIPHLTGPRGSYALVGLGAFLAGTTHAPLTALFLLFEMTGSYEITLPAMIATVTALVVARSIEEESIDTYRLAREGKTLQIGRDRLALTQIPVGAVMTRDVQVVSENSPLSDVLRAAGETPQSTLPVVSSDGELSGVIVTRDLLTLLAGGSELGPLVNAYDLANRNCAVVTPEDNLANAGETMEHEALDELPVVERRQNGRFLGLVTRQHIAQALNRVSVSLSALATRDHSIFWATGYRVTRLEVPGEAAGQTLRKLDPRARFGVSVLAVQNASDSEAGFVPIPPDRALKAGDLIVVAGRPPDIRRFERELEHPAVADGGAKPAQAPSGKR